MTTLLQEHKQNKISRVSLLDRLSLGLGIMGGLLIMFSISQPKNPANGLRLLFGLGFFTASVACEHIRKPEEESLERTEELEKNLKSGRITDEVAAQEAIYKLQKAEELYAVTPIDRHPYLAEVLEIPPPNLEARKQQAAASAGVTVETAARAVPADPTGSFDPEIGRSPSQPTQSDPTDYFVPAALVKTWFEGQGDRIPQGLKDAWKESPGMGISVEGNNVKIITGGSNS
jgi:hypothetical protein